MSRAKGTLIIGKLNDSDLGAFVALDGRAGNIDGKVHDLGHVSGRAARGLHLYGRNRRCLFLFDCPFELANFLQDRRLALLQRGDLAREGPNICCGLSRCTRDN